MVAHLEKIHSACQAGPDRWADQGTRALQRASPARLGLLAADLPTMHQRAEASEALPQMALRPMGKVGEPGLLLQVVRYAADQLARCCRYLWEPQRWAHRRQEQAMRRTERLKHHWRETGSASHQNHLTMGSSEKTQRALRLRL